jgi:hypothetical protein
VVTKSSFWAGTLAIAIAPAAFSKAEIPKEKPIEVGLQKQLLVDDWALAQKENLTRKLGTVVKANGGKPLVFTRVDKDGRRVPIDVWPLFATVYYDSARQKFRMWHRVSFDDRSRRQGKDITTEEIGVGASYHRGYSESRDGIHFEFVALLEGLTTGGDTNLVVTIDDDEPDPAHRYKVGYDCDCDVHGAALAHSADGIHWTPYNGGKPVTYRAADFTNQITWDPKLQVHRLFTRTDFGAGGGPFAGRVDIQVDGQPLEVRGARSMVNSHLKADPTDWKLEHHWLLDGEEQLSQDRPPIDELLKDPRYLERVRKQALRRQIYVMTDWGYQDQHFGLMSLLEYPTDVSEGVESDHVTRHERSIENYYIANSRDSVSWNFHWIYAEQPFVPRGPASSWDKDMVFPTSQIITHKDKHWIYYGGNNERHGAAEKDVWFVRQGSIGLAWLRLDGFVSLVAGQQEGSLITKPFKLEGRRLQLNVDAGDNGTIRVEILDAASQPIPGFSGDQAKSCRGVDELRLEPAWTDHSDLSALTGQTVRLKIHLEKARLCAFQIQL